MNQITQTGSTDRPADRLPIVDVSGPQTTGSIAPKMIGFEVPNGAPADMQLMTILGAALDRFSHVPPRHLRAALTWFRAYSVAKVDEYEADSEE